MGSSNCDFSVSRAREIRAMLYDLTKVEVNLHDILRVF